MKQEAIGMADYVTVKDVLEAPDSRRTFARRKEGCDKQVRSVAVAEIQISPCGFG